MNEHTKHFSRNTWRGGSIHAEASFLRGDPQFRNSFVTVEHTRAGTPEIVIKLKSERDPREG